MKIDFKGLLEGAWNSVFIKKEIETVADLRISICKGCAHGIIRKIPPFDFHCGLCGCNLQIKTRCLSCECPLKKWGAEVSEKEEDEIEEKLKRDQEDGKDK